MLTNSLKILVTTKSEFIELKFFQSDQKIWQNYYHKDLGSVLDVLTWWLSVSVLGRHVLSI